MVINDWKCFVRLLKEAHEQNNTLDVKESKLYYQILKRLRHSIARDINSHCLASRYFHVAVLDLPDHEHQDIHLEMPEKFRAKSETIESGLKGGLKKPELR